MSVEHARSGDVLSIDPAVGRTDTIGPVTLVRDRHLEVMRWVLPAGREVPEHLAYGPSTIQCVRGGVLLRLPDGERRLDPGALAYLGAGERHSVEALVESMLLVTMVLADDADDDDAAGERDPATDGRSGRPHGERTAPSDRPG